MEVVKFADLISSSIIFWKMLPIKVWDLGETLVAEEMKGSYRIAYMFSKKVEDW